jgi:hypothetical protein
MAIDEHFHAARWLGFFVPGTVADRAERHICPGVGQIELVERAPLTAAEPLCPGSGRTILYGTRFLCTCGASGPVVGGKVPCHQSGAVLEAPSIPSLGVVDSAQADFWWNPAGRRQGG